MKDYYYILGVTRTASTEEIKQAYRKLSVKFHPDKNDGDKFFEDRFKEINEAYEVLGNSARRISYNTAFADKATPRPSPYTHETPPRNESVHITSFTVDKSFVAIGDVITFSWEVRNAASVELKPFGKVIPMGQKSIKVLGFNQPEGLRVSLEAKDKTGITVTAHLIINRRLQEPIKPRVESVPIITKSKFSAWLIVYLPIIIVASYILFNKNSIDSKLDFSLLEEARRGFGM